MHGTTNRIGKDTKTFVRIHNGAMIDVLLPFGRLVEVPRDSFPCPRCFAPSNVHVDIELEGDNFPSYLCIACKAVFVLKVVMLFDGLPNS